LAGTSKVVKTSKEIEEQCKRQKFVQILRKKIIWWSDIGPDYQSLLWFTFLELSATRVQVVKSRVKKIIHT
jgi:hypothetical protein